MSPTSQPVDHELVRLFDVSLDAFCVAGFDGYLKVVNPAFARMLGYTREELLSRLFMDNVHPDDRESVGAVLVELAAGNDVVGFECREVCADGSVRWFEWNTSTRPGEGVVYGVARDVTERRAANAELGALRRVATLVAEGVRPQNLFAVVAEEVGRLFAAEATAVLRYDPDGSTVVGSWSGTGNGLALAGGSRAVFGGRNVSTLVFETGRPARIDRYPTDDFSAITTNARGFALASGVAAPISVDGRLWGALVIGSLREAGLPAGTEERLADFAELTASAIANAESREALGRLADEQAALRRVATRVAEGVPPAEIFSAVCEEVGRLVGSDTVAVVRFEHDPPAIVVVGVGRSVVAIPIGTRWALDDALASTEVYRTGRSARVDARDWVPAGGPLHEARSRLDLPSTVASPIVVEGRLWGTMSVSARQPLPADTEQSVERFSDLLATAIANAESREALGRLADEQAALRRVATLVAQGVRPAEIFSAVSEEGDRLFGLDVATLDVATVVRFDPGPEFVVVGAGKNTEGIPLGSHWAAHDLYVSTRVLRTGRSARVDPGDLASDGGPVAADLRRLGLISQVGSPIIVEGRLWGAVVVTAGEPLPPDTEERLEKFTELVATAIANADSRSQLAASRRRIVAASDEARRRIERDLHDGTQQRLVSLALAVRAAEATAPPDGDDLRTQLSRIATGLADAVAELQELSRGIHPAILSQGGLGPALRTLARRSAIPVELDVSVNTRFPEPIEVAAYYVASEALANATKHARASYIGVSLATRDGSLRLSIRDDGVGGADPARGSGLVGLADRVEALGGSIHVHSKASSGTHITAELPLELESAGGAD